MTYHAIFSPDGKQCSNACTHEREAWRDITGQCDEPALEIAIRKLREENYECRPIGCYELDKQVVVDRELYDQAAEYIRERTRLGWPIDWVKQFLNAKG